MLVVEDSNLYQFILISFVGYSFIQLEIILITTK